MNKNTNIQPDEEKQRRRVCDYHSFTTTNLNKEIVVINNKLDPLIEQVKRFEDEIFSLKIDTRETQVILRNIVENIAKNEKTIKDILDEIQISIKAGSFSIRDIINASGWIITAGLLIWQLVI